MPSRISGSKYSWNAHELTVYAARNNTTKPDISQAGHQPSRTSLLRSNQSSKERVPGTTANNASQEDEA